MNVMLAALASLNMASAFYVASLGDYFRATACLLLSFVLVACMENPK